MKQMKKLFFVTSFLMVMVLSPQVMADQVKVYQSSYSYGSGGEFTVNIVDPSPPGPDLSWVLSLYSINTKNQFNAPSFQTFCIEKVETFSPGTLYDVTISNNAIYGGVYPQVDPISVGTAWLYQNFAMETLANYNYSSDRSTSAGLLQATIWWLEGEAGDPGVNQTFRKLVVEKFGSETNAKADNNGYYPVMALNLWDVGFAGIDGHQHQDQLVLVPEPATMLFLGGGLLGMAGFLRKKFKK